MACNVWGNDSINLNQGAPFTGGPLLDAGMLELVRCEEFAVVTLNRPDVLNALNGETLTALDHMLDEVEGSDARCLILTGAGEKAFCAGADISEIADEPGPATYERTQWGQRLFSKLEKLRQPSIALVHGYALGGGCELALAATFRLATEKARFGLPEIKLGLVPGYGGTQRLPRLVGVPAALEIMLSGRMVDVEEAYRLGLVNRILIGDDRLEQAMAFGRQFTRWSLEAQRLIRDAAYGGIAMSLTDGLMLEARLSAESFATADGKEGIDAFLGKRPPRFLDR